MLSSWLRIKYPHAVQGAIAASAPIAAFLGQAPPYDPLSFGKQVMRDASAAGGASDSCASTVRSVWPRIFAAGESQAGRALLQASFMLCRPLNSSADALSLVEWLQSSFDFMAMGSYPFPSDYLLNGNGVLPPYPMRVACNQLLAGQGGAADDDAALFAAMRAAVSVFYNATPHTCFDLDVVGNNETTLDGRLWDYLACSQLEMPFARDGVHDMFWPQPWDPVADAAACFLMFGVQTRAYAAHIDYGGALLSSVSNIVFTNGELDPWLPGGVTQNISSSVLAYTLPDVGHHIDLMFTNPDTPQCVYDVRQVQVNNIKAWIQQHQQR
jgi:lysosomal Pro-X carboxypeptidase